MNWFDLLWIVVAVEFFLLRFRLEAMTRRIRDLEIRLGPEPEPHYDC